ncbi:MAG: alpha-amylase family protein [Polyangiales bacterium]
MSPARRPADWVQHAIFWHLYPLGFTGAEKSALGDHAVMQRLRHVEAWLDYAIELGCSGLALGPIFASETHGYDTLDHMKIDARLGDDHDFDHLVSAAHARGLKVVLDGVFNHVGRSFPRFRDVLANGEASRWSRWFRRKGPGPEDFAVFEGHGSLVTLNHHEPEVAAYVSEVIAHWLARGADGFRFDAAYAMPPAFFQSLLPSLRERFPEAFFFGEVIHGDYAQFVADGGLDSVTQYELWKATWSAINDRNFFELAWTLERHSQLLEKCLPLTFVGNHDVTRIASRITDERHLPHALVALLTLPGIPSIYAGDEQAFRGVKEERVGGDDAIRPAFPAEPTGLAPFGWPVYRLHQALIALRRRHPFLQQARLQIDTRTNPALVYTCKDPNTAAAISVVLNVGDEPYTGPFPLRRLLSSTRGEPGTAAEPAHVEPHGWLIGARTD